MTLNIVPKADTRHDAPFTFVITDSDMVNSDGVIYLIDVSVDSYFICGYGFTVNTPSDYETALQAALPVARMKAVARVTDMRTEIARLQAVVDKVTNHAD